VKKVLLKDREILKKMYISTNLNYKIVVIWLLFNKYCNNSKKILNKYINICGNRGRGLEGTKPPKNIKYRS
jgi:hypothetical protein